MVYRSFLVCLVLQMSLLGSVSMHAQKLQYWTDNDFSTLKTSEKEGDGSVSLQIPTNGLEAGIHFLNVRAIDVESNTYGNLFRTLFYIPSPQKDGLSPNRYIAWLDNEYDNRIEVLDSSSNLDVSMDVSALTQGIHFFNFLPYSVDNVEGNMLRTLIYVPDYNPTLDIAGYEYWIDEGEHVQVDGNEASISLALDVSDLEIGEHTFYFQAMNSLGHTGTILEEVFYLATPDSIEEIIGNEETYDVYNLNGVLVKRNASLDDLKTLPRAIYVVNGKKILF